MSSMKINVYSLATNRSTRKIMDCLDVLVAFITKTKTSKWHFTINTTQMTDLR